MIEMLGELIAAILGLIRKGEYNKASENLSQIYYDMLKQDAVFFRNIPESELTNKLLKEHNYTNGHLEILAELFYAEAELSLARSDTESTLAYTRKALLLFEYIDIAYKTYSQVRINKINTLHQRLNPAS